jgi:hypothetical protein
MNNVLVIEVEYISIQFPLDHHWELIHPKKNKKWMVRIRNRNSTCHMSIPATEGGKIEYCYREETYFKL